MTSFNDPEDEYLEDLIQLIPSDGDSTRSPESEGFSSYLQRSYVPITFFNNDKNIKLLNNCRPLCIELVDYKKVSPQVLKGIGIDSLGNYTTKDETIENHINRMTSNGVEIRRTVNINGQIKNVDFKKNKGLVGMKVSQTFEVLQIDSESDESQSNNEDFKHDINKEIDEIINEKNQSTQNDSADYTNSIRATTILSDEETSSTKNNLRNNDDQGGQLILGVKHNLPGGKYEMKCEIASMVNIKRKTEKDQSFPSNEAVRKEDNIHKCVIDNSEQNIQRKINVVGKKLNENNISNGPLSPVFPCTPPKKSKKFNKDRHDISTLVITQPKDFMDNRFKPNRINSPRRNNQSSSEKVSDMENDVVAEKISTVSKSTKQKETTLQFNNNINSNTTVIGKTNIAKNGQVISIDKMTSNVLSVEEKITPTSGKNDTLNIFRPETIENDKNLSATVLQSENDKSNIELIKNPKLDEGLYKNIIDRRKHEVQQVANASDSASHGQSNNLRIPKTSFVNQNIFQQKHLSQGNNLILPQNFSQNPSLASKRVHIFQKVGSAIVQEPNKTVESVDKRPLTLSKTRIRPYTGSISNLQPMINKLDKPKQCLQRNNSLLKNYNLGQPNLRYAARDTFHNNVSLVDSKISSSLHTDSSIKANKIQYAPNRMVPSQCKETSVSDDISNGKKFSSSSGYENNLKGFPQNVRHITAYKNSNISQNILPGCQRQSCCILSYGPQPRQLVRSMLRPDGTQVLSVGNYPKYMYANNIYPNSVPVSPYLGCTNNYNAYWPYLLPPPPPPPPPPPETDANISFHSTFSHTSGKSNTSDRKKVNIIKQINIVARPAIETTQGNSKYINKQNLIDVQTNNISPPKDKNDINNSEKVLSSKTEMFEELEKEMMNIHNEDLENLINKELRDNSSLEKRNIFKMPDLEKGCSKVSNLINVKETTKSITAHQGKKKKEQTTKEKDIILDEDNSKMRKNAVSDKTRAPMDAIRSTSEGYSPPILPIPSFQKTLEIITRASNDAQKRIAAKEKSRNKLSMCEYITKESNASDISKKISLDEYKKRVDKKRVCERKKRKYERKKEGRSVKKCLETKSTDLDQGYDSDTTIVLH